eukprot:306070_1
MDILKHQKKMFYYNMLWDHQVTWLGGQQLGRSINASMYESNYPEYNETLFSYNWVKDDFVVNVTDDTTKGNVMIADWNYGQPQVPFVNRPPHQGRDTHDFDMLQHDAQEASYRLYTEGFIYNMCGGPCNGTVPLETHPILKTIH